MTVTMLDRAAVSADPGRVDEQRRPDPEVPAKARRRTFTAEYKARIVAAYDAAPQGEKGAILRREGLYSSHIIDWRRTRDAAARAGREPARGRPPADPKDAQIARLTREKEQLEQELARARFVVEVQSKLQALLDTLSGSADTETKSAP
jgi:transposase